jgi:hypothetical protein
MRCYQATPYRVAKLLRGNQGFRLIRHGRALALDKFLPPESKVQQKPGMRARPDWIRFITAALSRKSVLSQNSQARAAQIRRIAQKTNRESAPQTPASCDR